MVASTSTRSRKDGLCTKAPRRSSTPTTRADIKQCTFCRLSVDVKNAQGIFGKKEDPVTFPHCEHALHAHCLNAWYRADLTPEQRALWDRRPYCKNKRAIALVQYDCNFGGRCETCALVAVPAN